MDLKGASSFVPRIRDFKIKGLRILMVEEIKEAIEDMRFLNSYLALVV